MNNGINRDNLVRVAPKVLVDDKGMNDLVETIAGSLDTLGHNIDLPTIYPRIDELPEGLLDILAKDFGVEWYDYNQTIEVKRATIRDSFYVHQHLGTAGALKQALLDVWRSCKVEEWFEYGGDPFHFRVTVMDEYSAEKFQKATELINLIKNARSVLDSIVFDAGNTTTDNYVGAGILGIVIVDTATNIDE